MISASARQACIAHLAGLGLGIGALIVLTTIVVAVVRLGMSAIH
jgi:hypothetical protein